MLWLAVTLWFVNRTARSKTTAVGYNRCVTRRRTRDENNAVRFREGAENQNRAGDTQPVRSSLTSLQGGAIIGTSWPLEDDIGRISPLSEICLFIYLSQLTSCGPFRDFYKELFCSFIEVRQFFKIIFPPLYVYGCTALVSFQSSFSFHYFVSVHVMHNPSIIVTVSVWNKKNLKHIQFITLLIKNRKSAYISSIDIV